jgi:hypothetical protein
MKISNNNPLNGLATVKRENEAADITIAEVLQLESFKGLSEEQAGELVASIKAFTQVVFFSCMGRKTA